MAAATASAVSLKLRGFAVVDQTLFTRLVDVTHVRFVHSIAQRLRRDGERESILQARKTAVIAGMEQIDRQAGPASPTVREEVRRKRASDCRKDRGGAARAAE